MRRRLLVAALPAMGLAPLAQAQSVAPPAELAAYLPQARLQGSGRLRFLGLRIYDSRLWAGAAPVGDPWAAVPLALEIEYARSLGGAQIAERSLAEMRRQAEPTADTAERWLAARTGVLAVRKMSAEIIVRNIGPPAGGNPACG
jgi:hypothetical protein